MIFDKSFFLCVLFFYVYYYSPKRVLIDYIFKAYFVSIDFLTFYNKLLYPEYWDEKLLKTELDENKNINSGIDLQEEKPQKKYEDKYLDDIRRLNKEWEFNEEELLELPILSDNFFNDSLQSIINRMKQIETEISNLEKDIDERLHSNSVNYIEDIDEDGNTLLREISSEEINENNKKQIKRLKEEYEKIKYEIDTDKSLENLKNKAEEESRQYIINKRLEKLANCFVMEKTPIGNVLMIYNKELGKFKYYSDSTMPYRYLEVVGRKYVKLFNCRPVFVDMEEELRLFEEKWENEQKIKREKEEEERIKNEEAAKNQSSISETKKKSVFAKFKSYNKDTGGKMSMAPPPKNNIPNKSVIESKENEKIILKERANCYTYDGKISNFSFLKKVEKKVFNKKLGVSFADFKKMSQQK